ncbi:MAG: hypothetical protein ACRCZB_05220 [Bacteroidales bacterium]
MILKDSSGKTKNSVGKSEKFNIVENEKLFTLLSDTIYTDKISACIRELSCNALDAHIESGTEKKFEVFLPTITRNEFRIRDYGNGLTKEQMTMYTTYGESTKTQTNAYIGAFGIGAKSPFAYTSAFSVTSFLNGTAMFYTMFIEGGVPKMTLMAEQETTLPNGLEVSFAVHKNDVEEFRTKSIGILSLMHDKLIVTQEESYKEDLERAILNWEAMPFIGEGYERADFLLRSDEVKRDLIIVQGSVRYTVSALECKEALEPFFLKHVQLASIVVNRTTSLENLSFSGFIKVPNGTFTPHPSRERISFSSEARKTLGDILFAIYEVEVIDRIKFLEKESDGSYVKLFLLLKKEASIVSKSRHFFTLKFPDYEENFYKWGTREINGVRVVRHSKNIVPTKQAISITHAMMLGRLIFNYTEKRNLSFETRLKLILDIKKRGGFDLWTEYVAYIITKNTDPIFTKKDLEQFIQVKDLLEVDEKTVLIEKSKQTVQRKIVSFSLGGASIDRLPFFEKIEVPKKGSIEEYKHFTSYVEITNPYEFNLFGESFSVQNNMSRLQIRRTFNPYVRDYLEETYKQNTSKAQSMLCTVLLLPKGHSLKNEFNSFESVIEASAKYMVDKIYDSLLLWEQPSYEEVYNDMVKELYKIGVFEKSTHIDRVVKEKYKKWALEGFPTPCPLRCYEFPSGFSFDKEYTEKLAEISRKVSSDERRLLIGDEVLQPLKKEFLLLGEIFLGHDRREYMDSVIEYINFMYSKKNT